MKAYGQFCPLAQATQLLCERWTLLIVREFIAGSTRYSELQKGVPLMSPTLLSTRLKQLVKAGVITMKSESGKNHYELTKAGIELKPVVELLGAWGHRWAQTNLDEGDLDAGLLMWDMRRSVDPAVFPQNRIVVQFEYPDAPKGAHDWWLISEDGIIDLCLSDPGYEVDILIKSSLADMTAVWTCQRPFKQAVECGDIKVMGDKKLASNLQDWLKSSLLSRLGSLEELPKLNWVV
ncbi:winged helix-turn-helix transcriptional regulator [Sedimenticola selenatireducens]|uniref:Helix-turn-helix transcriptional regulator n=1 Tax=Sedimenticola selenatireducens TaxID=191960 RepID=A0A558DYK9_9GAMM|nr:helix-turn-helix domain-containing protein [Sedimenticola selenatireducens]TVO71476.1 helix-turn-helix transcriptional regulator [Sedimenticola selenatireducens]TVT66165.1 MAG: helix-turn-helix transcriptional regulator [Sedimenticola selenatireducens]